MLLGFSSTIIGTKSLTHSTVQCAKFLVSPQSCQAWRIECKAADKQLISITGGKCVNVTSPDAVTTSIHWETTHTGKTEPIYYNQAQYTVFHTPLKLLKIRI